MNIAEATDHLIRVRKNGNRSCHGHGKWTYMIVLKSEWVKGSWFIAPSSKDGLGLNFAFYRYNYGGACRNRVNGRRGHPLGRRLWHRPQSSPILVEDAHAAVGVAEVPIIVRRRVKARY